MKQERRAATELPDHRRERVGLSRRRRRVPHGIVLAQRELRGHAADGARALGGQTAACKRACRIGGATGLRDLTTAARPEGQRAERRELPCSDALAGLERAASFGREREERLVALALRGRERRARAGGERGRQHRTDRVGHAAAVLARDPFRERELMRTQERKRMDEGIDLPERALVRNVERGDNAGD